MTDYSTDPTVLQRGMPPEQKNGLYGSVQDQLIAMGVGERFTAVVTFEVADIRSSEKDHVQWPVVALAHIEPIFDAAGIAVTRKAQEDAYKTRTGANQLNFEGITEPSESAQSQDEADAAFEAAAPKKTAAKK